MAISYVNGSHLILLIPITGSTSQADMSTDDGMRCASQWQYPQQAAPFLFYIIVVNHSLFYFHRPHTIAQLILLLTGGIGAFGWG